MSNNEVKIDIKSTQNKEKKISLIEKDTEETESEELIDSLNIEENAADDEKKEAKQVNIIEAADNRYLDFVDGSTNIKFSSQEILHFLAQLIEFEHKTDGYRYIYRNSYKLYLWLENLLSIFIQLATASTTLLSALMIIVKCNVSILEQWVIPITVLILAFGSTMTQFIKDKLGYQKALEANKELENYFNRLNRDIGEITDRYFIFYTDNDDKNITINFRKNADIENVMEQIKKDYKKFSNNYTNISGHILSKYKKKYRNKKVLINIAEYNNNYLSDEIILMNLGYDISKKDTLPKIKIIDTSYPIVEEVPKKTNPLIRRFASRFKQKMENESTNTNEQNISTNDGSENI